MSDTVKYFERLLRKIEKAAVAADRRGDEGAVKNLMRKMEYHRDAVQALRKLRQLEADNKKLAADLDALMADIHMVAYDEMNDEGPFICCLCSKGFIPADCDYEKSNCDFKWCGRCKGDGNE